MKDMFLWSSYFWDNYESVEEAKKVFAETIMDNSTYESEEEITSDDIFREFNSVNDEDYYHFKLSILNHDKEKRKFDGAFLVVADIGLWDGRKSGGRIIPSLSSVLREVASGVSDVKYEIKNNDLFITGHHHDGTNYYTVKYITPKGYDWALRNYSNYCETSRECHERLLKTKGYTRKMFSKDWKFEWGEVM